MARWQANGWLLLVTFFWGSSFFIVKNALAETGPFAFIAGRFWVAGAALGLLFLLRGGRATPGLWRDGVLAGLLLGASFVTQTIGLQTTEAGKAAFITGLNVVLVPLFAAALLRQSPPRAAIAGVLLATFGLGLMTLDSSLQLAMGDAWELACAIVFALHVLSLSRFGPRHEVLPFILVQIFTVATLSTLAALLWEREALLPPLAVVPAVLYMGLLATAFAFGVQTWVQRYTSPTHAALIFALEPVAAALFAVLFTQEQIEGREWLGGGMIILGMLVAELGEMWRARQATRSALLPSTPSLP